jgi:hypothetical protein
MGVHKHTPGPWRLGKQGKTNRHINAGAWSSFVKVVTIMEGDSEPNKQGMANATLIAAAPDMFEALVGLIRRFDTGEEDTNPEWIEARRAIAKAIV